MALFPSQTHVISLSSDVRKLRHTMDTVAAPQTPSDFMQFLMPSGDEMILDILNSNSKLKL